jgi:putative membrane protein
MMWGTSGDEWMTILGVMTMMSLFWGAAALLVVWVLRGWRDRDADQATRPGTGGGAVEILKARFARGEITREQFEEMRRVIGE